MSRGLHAKPKYYETNIKPLVDAWVDEFKDGAKEFSANFVDSVKLGDEGYQPEVAGSFYDQDKDFNDHSSNEELKPIFDYSNLDVNAKKAAAIAVIAVSSVATAGIGLETPAAAATPSVSANNNPAAATITVKSGDSLTKIADRLNPSSPQTLVNQIAKINNLSNPNLIYPGESLKVPTTSSAALGYTSVTLKPGQTISALVQQEGSTVAAFAAANPGVNPNVVYAGQAYNIPIGTVAYAINPGDSLWKIATPAANSPVQTASTVNEIQTLNPGINPNDLQPGQTIELPGNVAVAAAAESANNSQSAPNTAPANNSVQAPVSAPEAAVAPTNTNSSPVLAAESTPATPVTQAPETASSPASEASVNQPKPQAASQPAAANTAQSENKTPTVVPSQSQSQASVAAPSSQPLPETAQATQSTTVQTPSSNPSTNNQQPSAQTAPATSSNATNNSTNVLGPKAAAAIEQNSGDLVGNVTIQELADYLEAKTILTKIAIAGIIGNFKYESGLNTEQLQGQPLGEQTTYQSLTSDQVKSGSVGFGLAQETPPSKYGVWAEANNLDPNAMSSQLQYIIQNYPNLLTLLNKATTPQQSSDIFLNDFENPFDKAASQVQREQYAAQAYAVITGNNSSVNNTNS